jgi:hypothetical protein
MGRNQREMEGDNEQRRANRANVGARRRGSDDQEVPAEIPGKREAQDRSGGESSNATSPVDSMHVDAPKHQDNRRGHARDRASE